MKDIYYSFKKLTKNDVTDDYISWLNNPEINQFLEVRHTKQNKQIVQEYINSFYQDEEKYIWGIYDSETLIGTTTLSHFNYKKLSAEIGLMIGDKSYWGKLASDSALQFVFNFSFNDLQLESITGGCYDKNMGIVFTFKKLGFVREHIRGGTKENVAHQWRIFKNQWLKSQC